MTGVVEWTQFSAILPKLFFNLGALNYQKTFFFFHSYNFKLPTSPRRKINLPRVHWLHDNKTRRLFCIIMQMTNCERDLFFQLLDYVLIESIARVLAQSRSSAWQILTSHEKKWKQTEAFELSARSLLRFSLTLNPLHIHTFAFLFIIFCYNFPDYSILMW